MLYRPDQEWGVATREQVAGLTGLETLRAMLEGRLPAPPICRTLAMILTEVTEGVAVFEGEPSPDLLNPLGIVHGGWALALIDSAAGCAAHSTLPAGVSYSTVETKVNFTRPILPDIGRVRCAGQVVHAGRQVISAAARLEGADGKLLAHGTSTLLVLAPR